MGENNNFNSNFKSDLDNQNTVYANSYEKNGSSQNNNAQNVQNMNINDKNKKTKKPRIEKQKKNSNFNFGRSIALPFASGILGACLVAGVIVGTPGLKSAFVQTQNTTANQNSSQQSSSTTSQIDTTQISLKNYSDTGIAVANKVLPSVVGIEVNYEVNSLFSIGSSTATGEGSGVIITDDGYILTNNHVISSSSSSSTSSYEIGKAKSINVYLYNDDTAYPAKVIGSDEQSDLAVIKIEKTGLTAAELGDSSSVQIGEWCMAIGNPLGMKSSVTTGTISATNREVTDENGQTLNVIQTDAAINAGNSGGALVNTEGKVIGINTMKASGTGVEGLGFAIPINTTKSIYSDLVNYQKVKRAYLGIAGANITEDTVKANPNANLVVGVLIRSVDNDSSAGKGGLQTGDIIIKADDKDITTIQELREYIQSKNIGDKVKITYVRNGNVKTTEVTLQEQ